MSTKKKRVVVALDDNYINILDYLCNKYHTKQYSKVIKILLDLIIIK